MKHPAVGPILRGYAWAAIFGTAIGAVGFFICCGLMQFVEELLLPKFDLSTFVAVALVGVVVFRIVRGLKLCPHPRYLDTEVFYEDLLCGACFFGFGGAVVGLFAQTQLGWWVWMMILPMTAMSWFSFILLLTGEDVITPNLPHGNSTT